VDLVWFLLIGLAAGWLAGQLSGKGGFGLLGDLLVGVIGAFLGGWLFGLMDITPNGKIGALVIATIGAFVLVVLVRLVKKV
jgi:uncharacterized membrane protein YeaQ/YmgE (transglycosylase-associated protein family)